MWVTTTDLPTAASHPFYRRLNQLLREHGCDDFAEARCATVLRGEDGSAVEANRDGFTARRGNGCFDAVENCSSARAQSLRDRGARRVQVRGDANRMMRLLVRAGAFNPGLWMRKFFGISTLRTLQGRLGALAADAQRLIESRVRCDRADLESDSVPTTIGHSANRSITCA
jgi:hypothetical protein